MKSNVYVYNMKSKCIRLHYVAVTMLFFFVLVSCVSNYPKNVMDPPWIPEADSASAVGEMVQPDEKIPVPVYFSEDDLPAIDGRFDDWKGLDGPVTRLAVFGGSHKPDDAEAFFVLRTDGINLYVYARATDDMIHENFLPGSMAWRGDTVEFYFGSNTSRHKKYVLGDNQIRLVPRGETFDVDIVINQRTAGEHLMDGAKGALFKGAAVYGENLYEVEASIPLSMLMIDGLELGQKVRCDFQINDADETERDRMVHWMSTGDTPYYDPSTWGNGKVVELPAERKETVNEL